MVKTPQMARVCCRHPTRLCSRRVDAIAPHRCSQAVHARAIAPFRCCQSQKPVCKRPVCWARGQCSIANRHSLLPINGSITGCVVVVANAICEKCPTHRLRFLRVCVSGVLPRRARPWLGGNRLATRWRFCRATVSKPVRQTGFGVCLNSAIELVA